MESGIHFQRAEHFSIVTPKTLPARLTHFLYERYRFFNGAPEKGLIILLCELIEHNGKHLKKYILQYSSDWALEEPFIIWLHEANYVYNTLVNYIVPRLPKSEYVQLRDE